MVGTAQADCSGGHAGGGASRFRHLAGTSQFAVIQAVAPSLGVESIPVNVHDASEIERSVGAFARSGNGGLIVTAGG